jgi:hypothetical protein
MLILNWTLESALEIGIREYLHQIKTAHSITAARSSCPAIKERDEHKLKR